MEEEPLINKEKSKEKTEDSLLNYEYGEDDDGVNWDDFTFNLIHLGQSLVVAIYEAVSSTLVSLL